MFRTTHGLLRLVAVFAVAALTSPASSIALDYRNPDSKAAAVETQQGSPVDLRSPDAKDVGQVAQTPPAPPETAKATGFDWGDAGIGAGTVLGMLLITVSIMFTVMHRRSRKDEGSRGPALTS